MTLVCPNCDYTTLLPSGNPAEAPQPFMAYNNFAFPSHSTFTSQATNIYGDNRIDVKYVRLIITIRFPTSVDAIHGSNSPEAANPCFTLDPNSSQARMALATPGAPLILRGTGAGIDLEINPVDGKTKFQNINYDILYGPKPSTLNYTPIAGNRGGEYEWQCEIHLAPQCRPTSPGLTWPFTEFTYSVSWTIDPNTSRTVRIISGQLEVAGILDRRGNVPPRILQQSIADTWREKINNTFPYPVGTNRGYQWNLSADHRTLDFTLTDTEIPGINVWPEDIINPQVTYTLTNSTISLGTWNATLSGSFVVNPAAGDKARIAWEYIWLLVNTKVDAQRRHRIAQQKQGKGEKYQQTKTISKAPTKPSPETGIIITNFTITEEVYGDTVSFSITLMMWTQIEDLLSRSGIWEKMPPTDTKDDPSNEAWRRWRTSVDITLNPRGFAGMRYVVPDGGEAIINICRPFGSKNLRQEEPDTNQPQRPEKDLSKRPTIYDEESHIKYETQLDVIETPNTITHHFLVKPKNPPHRLTLEGSSPSDYYKDFSGMTVSEEKTTPDQLSLIQRRRPSTFKIVLSGEAIRAGYAPSIPSLERVGDSIAYLEDRRVATREIGNAGVPLFASAWRLTYSFAAAPTGDLSRINTHEDGPHIIGDRYTGVPI